MKNKANNKKHSIIQEIYDSNFDSFKKLFEIEDPEILMEAIITVDNYGNSEFKSFLQEEIKYLYMLDEQEMSLLSIASALGNIEATKILLKLGAEINGSGEYKPMHVAAYYNQIEIIKLLLTKDTNLEDTNYDGETILHIACRKNYLKLVKFLIAKGAYINARSNNGETPLLAAVANSQNKELIQTLVDAGADKKAVDSCGRNILDLALEFESSLTKRNDFTPATETGLISGKILTCYVDNEDRLHELNDNNNNWREVKRFKTDDNIIIELRPDKNKVVTYAGSSYLIKIDAPNPIKEIKKKQLSFKAPSKKRSREDSDKNHDIEEISSNDKKVKTENNSDSSANNDNNNQLADCHTSDNESFITFATDEIKYKIMTLFTKSLYISEDLLKTQLKAYKKSIKEMEEDRSKSLDNFYNNSIAENFEFAPDSSDTSITASIYESLISYSVKMDVPFGLPANAGEVM